MRLILLMVALFLAAAAHAAERTRALDQLDLKIWNTDQGLPHNSVLSVGQTRDGMLWVGTWGGLARFDGVEFRNYTRDNTPAIGDNGMLTMSADTHGGLWVGTHRGGLLHVEDGRVEAVVAAGTSIGSHVLAVLELGDALWIGTEGAGLYVRRNGKVEQVLDANIGADATVSALSADPRGGLLIGTRAGAFRRVRAGADSVAIELPPAAVDAAVSGLSELYDGTLWLATSRGVFRRRGDAWKQFGAAAATSLSFGRRGEAWIGTPAQGVLRIDGDELQQLRTVHGLPDSRVRWVLEDRDGGIWLGTNGGLVGLQSLPFGGIGTLQGLTNDYVRGVLQTADGGVWIATARGLNRYEDGRLRRLESIESLADTSLLALAEDHDRTLWVGTYADGLLALRNGGTFVPEGLKLPNPQVRAILIARDGTFWIGSQGGLVHYDPHAHRTLPPPAHAPTASVMALHEDAAGRIWIGTSEGLSRIVDGKVEEFGPAQGFPGEAVFAFLEDPSSGALWIGSDAGLVHLRDERFTVLGPAQGLPFYSVLGIQRDEAGSFWLASGSGVLRIAGSDIEGALRDPTHKLSGRQFNRDDGMPSSQCNGGSMPSSVRLSSGELWFATARGVALVDPRTVDDRTPEPPNVVINDVLVDDREVAAGVAPELGPGRHAVAVQFAAIALSRQGQVDNAYRVRGLDEHWSFIGAERSVRLTTIPHGDYVLEVAARYGHGALSAEPARFAFSVEPMLWQRPWFIAVAALILVLAIVALVQRRTASLRHRGIELSRLVAEQTQALAREMKVIAQRDQEKSELLAKLEANSRELERLAREDGLTRVCNRRHFDERLNQLASAARGNGAAPSVLMFDLDHFKDINDARSHHVGDLVLMRFAELLREEFPDGVIGRYGGEEFVVALPGIDRVAAQGRAETLRRRVEAEPWAALDTGLRVTVSAGVAGPDSGAAPVQLIRTADARLYEAKRSGRNRVV